jgi:hypothetical protein
MLPIRQRYECFSIVDTVPGEYWAGRCSVVRRRADLRTLLRWIGMSIVSPAPICGGRRPYGSRCSANTTHYRSGVITESS